MGVPGTGAKNTETLWMSGDVFPNQEGRQKCIRIDVFPVCLSGTVKCVYIISLPFKNISAHVWPRQRCDGYLPFELSICIS